MEKPGIDFHLKCILLHWNVYVLYYVQTRLPPQTLFFKGRPSKVACQLVQFAKRENLIGFNSKSHFL